MELASNLVWLLVTLALCAGTIRAARRRELRVPPRSGFALVLFICLLLLPVISVSDDLLEARQATLPASAQTWHLASQEISSAVEIVPVLLAFLLIIHALALVQSLLMRWNPGRSTVAIWLTRSHPLRPPPVAAL